MEILYSNTQTGATSFMQVKAEDVAIGVWEIYWTTDFVTVNFQPAADGGGAGA